MHLTANMYKIVSVKANAKEIAAVKCICHQICTKWLLWRQMLRKLLLENAFDAKYVQNHHIAGLSMIFFLHVTSVYANVPHESSLINVIKFYIIVLFCISSTAIVVHWRYILQQKKSQKTERWEICSIMYVITQEVT